LTLPINMFIIPQPLRVVIVNNPYLKNTQRKTRRMAQLFFFADFAFCAKPFL